MTPAPRDTLWTLEPHTQGKHEVLRHYLAAWFPILGLTQGRIVFIDGFAGPGQCAAGMETEKLIEVSPKTRKKQRTLPPGTTLRFI